MVVGVVVVEEDRGSWQRAAPSTTIRRSRGGRGSLTHGGGMRTRRKDESAEGRRRQFCEGGDSGNDDMSGEQGRRWGRGRRRGRRRRTSKTGVRLYAADGPVTTSRLRRTAPRSESWCQALKPNILSTYRPVSTCPASTVFRNNSSNSRIARYLVLLLRFQPAPASFLQISTCTLHYYQTGSGFLHTCKTLAKIN